MRLLLSVYLLCCAFVPLWAAGPNRPVQVKFADRQEKAFHINNVTLGVTNGPIRSKAPLVVRIFTGTLEQVKYELPRYRASDGCRVYVTNVKRIESINDLIDLRRYLTESFLRGNGAGGFLNTAYTLVVETGTSFDKVVKIDDKDVETYFRHAYSFVLLADHAPTRSISDEIKTRRRRNTNAILRRDQEVKQLAKNGFPGRCYLKE